MNNPFWARARWYLLFISLLIGLAVGLICGGQDLNKAILFGGLWGTLAFVIMYSLCWLVVSLQPANRQSWSVWALFLAAIVPCLIAGLVIWAGAINTLSTQGWVLLVTISFAGASWGPRYVVQQTEKKRQQQADDAEYAAQEAAQEHQENLEDPYIDRLNALDDRLLALGLPATREGGQKEITVTEQGYEVPVTVRQFWWRDDEGEDALFAFTDEDALARVEATIARLEKGQKLLEQSEAPPHPLNC